MQLWYYSQIAHDLRSPLTTIALDIDCAAMSKNARVRQTAEECGGPLAALYADVVRLDPNRHSIPDAADAHFSDVAQALRQNLWVILNAFGMISNVVRDSSDPETQSLTESLKAALDIVDLADPQLRHSNSTTSALSMESELQRAFSQRKSSDGSLGLMLSVVSDFKVHASRAVMNRLFSNLIVNAIAAVRKSGKSHGYVSATVCATSSTAGTVVIEDSGIGIAAEDLGRIWDQSFTTSEGEGHGYGMGIVREMATRMRAVIDVTSTLGEGTRFTLTFAE